MIFKATGRTSGKVTEFESAAFLKQDDPSVFYELENDIYPPSSLLQSFEEFHQLINDSKAETNAEAEELRAALEKAEEESEKALQRERDSELRSKRLEQISKEAEESRKEVEERVKELEQISKEAEESSREANNSFNELKKSLELAQRRNKEKHEKLNLMHNRLMKMQEDFDSWKKESFEGRPVEGHPQKSMHTV